MPQQTRSLADLEDLARARLAAGDRVGIARAMLACPGDDLVCVKASPAADGKPDAPAMAYALNEHPTRPRAIELLIAAYGASVLGPATSF